MSEIDGVKIYTMAIAGILVGVCANSEAWKGGLLLLILLLPIFLRIFEII